MPHFKHMSIYEELVRFLFVSKHNAGSLKWPLYPKDVSATVLPAYVIV